MANAFSEFLPDFGLSTFDGFDPSGHVLAGTEPAMEPDPLAEAEARGRREGHAAAELSFATRLKEEKADFEHRLAEKEQYWLGEIAASLAAGLTEGLARIEAAIADSAARATARILAGALRERALDELDETVKALLAADGGAGVRIAAPAELIDRLRVSFAGMRVEFAVDARPEVLVTTGDTAIETRIGAWADRIAAAEADNG